jgi:hypothetical protein
MSLAVLDAAGASQTIETLPSVGAKAAAASLPVTRSTEDAAATGALIETAPTTDTGSSGLNGRLQRIAQRLTTLLGVLPALLGRTAAAGSLAVVLSTEDAAATGALTETAPATDTASSGLNGRLQRIAQRLTTLLGVFPASLGRTAAAGSLAVVLSTEDAANQTAPIASAGLDASKAISVQGITGGKPLSFVGSRTFVTSTFTQPQAAVTYASGNSIGGVVGVDLGLGPNVSIFSIFIRIAAPVNAAGYPGAIGMGIIFFNASPTASTLTDNNPVVIAAADLSKTYPSATANSATSGGLASITFQTVRVTTDANGKIWFSLVAIASTTFGAANCGIARIDGLF